MFISIRFSIFEISSCKGKDNFFNRFCLPCRLFQSLALINFKLQTRFLEEYIEKYGSLNHEPIRNLFLFLLFIIFLFYIIYYSYLLYLLFYMATISYFEIKQKLISIARFFYFLNIFLISSLIYVLIILVTICSSNK